MKMGRGSTVKPVPCVTKPAEKAWSVSIPVLPGAHLYRETQVPSSRPLLEGRGAMPSFASDLTDSEIADVISFIRSSWDNDAPPVTRELVTDAGADLEMDDAPRR